MNFLKSNILLTHVLLFVISPSFSLCQLEGSKIIIQIVAPQYTCCHYPELTCALASARRVCVCVQGNGMGKAQLAAQVFINVYNFVFAPCLLRDSHSSQQPLFLVCVGRMLRCASAASARFHLVRRMWCNSHTMAVVRITLTALFYIAAHRLGIKNSGEINDQVSLELLNFRGSQKCFIMGLAFQIIIFLDMLQTNT